jgi:hypothetical protein
MAQQDQPSLYERLGGVYSIATVVDDLREVSLLGTVDLAFWEERLRTEGLLPAPRAGQVQLLIVAAGSATDREPSQRES